MKVCKKCNKEKELSEFSKNKLSSDGHIDKCKQCFKEYYHSNKILFTKKRLQERESRLIYHYKADDRKKGLVCELTSEWMKENITSKPCIYCGEIENIGCDRIDNNIGHTKDNCVPSCIDCNLARGNRFNLREMMEIGNIIRSIKIRRKNIVCTKRAG